jgi:O-antigen/teichoic acid export membrane protein
VKVKALLRGSLLYTLGNFVPRVGAFLLLPVYAVVMTPSEFGVLSLMLSLAGLLAIVYRLGLDGALLRLHFDQPARDRPSLYLSAALTTLAASIALSVVIGLLTAPIFPRVFPGVAFFPYGVTVLALTITTSLQYVPAVLFRAGEWPDRFLTFALGIFLLGAAATLFFLIVLQRGPGGALAGQLVGGIGVVAVTALILVRLPSPRFDADQARTALRIGLPLMPHAVAAWVLNLSDRLLIGALIGLPALAAQAAIGIYSFGAVLGQGIALVALSFNAAWVPFWLTRGDGDHGPRLLRETTTLFIGGLALLTVAAGSLAPEVTRVFASLRWGLPARPAQDVITIVSLSGLIYGLYFMLVSTLFLRRRTAALPPLILTAAAVNVASNLVLIPRLGITGAAWSAVAGYATLSALTWWYASRSYPIQLDLPRLGAIGLGAAAAIAVSRLVRWEDTGLYLSTGFHLAMTGAFAFAMVPLMLRPLAQLRAMLAGERAEARAGGTANPTGSTVTPPTAGTMGHPEEHA